MTAVKIQRKVNVRLRHFNQTCHKALWNWLSRNPTKGKHEWPAWEYWPMEIYMKNEELNKKVFELTKHRELWDWILENPTYDKENWPGWEKYKIKNPHQFYHCFACKACYYE